MKKWLCSSTILALSITTLMYAGFDGKRVQSITVRTKDSSEIINEDSILRRLHTHTGGSFSQDQFDKDIKALSKDYENVMPRLVENGDQIQIILTLAPKPTIHTIEWKGNDQISSSTLLKELGVEKDTLLDKAKLHEGIGKIRQYYLKHGYFQVRVRYTIENDGHDRAKLILHIEEGVSGKIRKITYDDISNKELKHVENELILQKYNFFTSWYTGRGQYIEDAMELDRNRLIHELQDQGYADSVIEGQAMPSPKNNGVELLFKAQRGELYKIQHIEMTGVSPEHTSHVQALMNVKDGDLYSPGRLRKVVEKIQEYYGNKGYCDILVNYVPVIIDSENRLYDVSLHVKEGTKYKVGMVRFSGNYVSKPRVIMHEALVVPGEVMSTRKLESTEKRLMNTGYFKSVHIRTVDSKPDGFPEGDYKDVVIEVEEADSTTKLSFKLGASMQEGAYGGVTASFDNFYLKGVNRLFRDGFSAVRGNGEHLGLDTSFSRHTTDYTLSWTDPYFLETPWSFGVDLDRHIQRVYNQEQFSDINQGATVYGYYPFNNFVRLKLSQGIREERTHLSEQLALSPEAQQSISNGVYNTQSIGIIYDSTNRIQLPSLGFRSFGGISVTEGPREFMRASYHNAYYWSPECLEEGTFKVRVDFDALTPFNSNHWTIPLSQRLRLGGEDNLRGYQFGQLGDRDSQGNALGGISRVIYSAEYLYRINSWFALFAFSDNGAISNTSYHVGQNYHSTGWGVRFDVLGRFPIIFGIGYPLTDKENRSLTRRYFFSIGGRF